MTTKGNFPHLDVAKLILFIIVGAIVWGFLFSCSAQYHLRKFEKKGGIIERKADTLTLQRLDSVLIHTKDSSFYRYYVTNYDTIINKVYIHTKTRQEIRFNYKRFNDSLRHELKKYKDSLRSTVKTHKIDVKKDIKTNKKKRPIYIPILLLLILLVITFKLSK